MKTAVLMVIFVIKIYISDFTFSLHNYQALLKFLFNPFMR